MEEKDDFRINIDKELFGPGNWNEILTVFCDSKEMLNDDKARISYVAKFGVFKDPRSWGRLFASLVKTISEGEVRTFKGKESDIERVEAQIVEGFNDVLIGTDSIKLQRIGIFEDSLPSSSKKKTEPPSKNWDPGKNDFSK